ncbi:hypothetical protein FAIPA1_10342 [Frankia sp. AiPs1]
MLFPPGFPRRPHARHRSVRGAQPAVFQEFLAADLVVTLDVHPAYHQPAITQQQGTP